MDRRHFLKTAALAAAATPAARALPVPFIVVKTTHGPVAGYRAYARSTRETRGPIDVAAFKGIPYGADTATTRFAAPRPPTPWTEPLACNDWPAKAPQVPGARPDPAAAGHSMIYSDARHTFIQEYRLPPDLGRESEDCLNLNLWTPDASPRRRRPVMVYIHGGAYSNGTVNSELYDGTNLARSGDVVVVTVNHRLNLFGYLYLADLLPGAGFEDSGNAGQLDLVLALEWVRDNIARFGGDPRNVLIFGQSGGGAKCATLMAQPPAHGLFHRVITMSGQQVTGATPAHATARARAALDFLHIDPEADPVAAAKHLRTLPWPQLAAACKAHGYFGPVTDGRSLPRDPFAPDAAPLSAHIPLMLGNTHDETRLLIGGGQPALFALTWESLPAALEKNAPFLRSDAVSLPVAEVIATYRTLHPDYTASDVFFAVTTDSRSWRGQVIEADRRAEDPAAQPRTWVYQLNWRSLVDNGRFGAPHTLDIPLAFRNTGGDEWGMLGSSRSDPRHAERMSDIVSARFVAFARYGNPNGPSNLPNAHSPLSAAGDALTWPAFDLTRRATMIFDDPPRIEDDPRGTERRLLGQIPYTQPGT